MTALTLDLLREAKRKLDEIGPAPLPIRVSEHATALPSGKPRTDDMRQMVERLGRQRVPAAFRVNSLFGGCIVVHPDLMKNRTK